MPETVRRLVELLRSARCQQMMANAPDRIFYIDTERGLLRLPADAVTAAEYQEWIAYLVSVCDIGETNRLESSPLPIIEGSFLPQHLPVAGSIHVATRRVTRSHPAITVRKQPDDKITLDQMVGQSMLTTQMRDVLVAAVRGRANLLISGGSGAGKTTLARALSLHIPPDQRVVTAEEIDELALGQHLPNTVSMTTWRSYDDEGVLRSEVTLEQLVREALRMRPDRIWVGETRGKEAYALVKACNSGHDGSATTVHGDDVRAAIGATVAYVRESGLDEESAADQIARAFHLAVQIRKTSPSTRVISEISELEPVREGSAQRVNPLFRWEDGRHVLVGDPTNRLVEATARFGVDLMAPFRTGQIGFAS